MYTSCVLTLIIIIIGDNKMNDINTSEVQMIYSLINKNLLLLQGREVLRSQEGRVGLNIEPTKEFGEIENIIIAIDGVWNSNASVYTKLFRTRMHLRELNSQLPDENNVLLIERLHDICKRCK